MGPEITTEIWVRPIGAQRGCIIAVEEGAGGSRKERFRIEVMNNSINANYSNIKMQLNVTQSNQWFHIAF